MINTSPLLRRIMLTVLTTILLQSVAPAAAQTHLEIKQIVATVQPSIVFIETFDRDGAALAIGSGFVCRGGAVITNRHVLQYAWTARVKPVGAAISSAVVTVSGMDRIGDLCALRVPGLKCRDLPLAKAANVAVGDDIIVAGNPKGLEGTISAGIVSGTNRFGGLLQIDAAISSGSSGGPVLNRDGQVVGVAVASLVSGQNLNFAIPVDQVAALPLTWSIPVKVAGYFALSDSESKGLHGPVKTLLATRYDVEFTNIDDKMPRLVNPRNEEAVTFNESGLEVWRVEYDNGEQLEATSTYFDAYGFPTAYITSNFRTGKTERTETTREREVADAAAFLGPSTGKTVTGKSELTYRIDRYRQVIESWNKLRYAGSDSVDHMKTEYSDVGRPTHSMFTHEHTDPHLDWHSEDTYEYDDDALGNWIRQIDTSYSVFSGVPASTSYHMTVRTISYF